MQLEEERVHFSLQLSCHVPSLREVRAGTQAGTWRQEQRSWRNSVYWLTTHGLLSLLSFTTQDHLPRVGTTHSELCTPATIIIRTTPHRVAYRPVLDFMLLPQSPQCLDTIHYTTPVNSFLTGLFYLAQCP